MIKRLNAILWVSVCAVALVVPLLVSRVAHADVNTFTINAFDADYTLTNDDHQGTLQASEHIAVTFTDQNHGIERAIPNKYKNHRLQLDITGVRSVSGAPANYRLYQSNGNTVVRIGDADKTVTGTQDYTIDYTVHNVIGFYPDHDELYWDVNGDGWAQPAQQVSMLLHLPTGLTVNQPAPACYTGSYGSQTRACTISATEKPGKVVAKTTATMQPYQTLSVVTAFQKGYFQPITWYETAGEYAKQAGIFLVPFVLVAGVAAWQWWRFGRDLKGRTTIVPEYDAPDGLRPIEAGTVVDFSTGNGDITATIIDLAIRGYIKIIESKQERKLRKDITVYSLRLEKADWQELEPFERSILVALFIKRSIGEEVDLSALKFKLAAVAATLRKTVRERLVSKGYFRKHTLAMGLTFAAKLSVAFVAALIFSAIVAGLAIAGIIAGAIAALIFIILLPSRTEKGVEAKRHILGLKRYLEVAEAERIDKLQAPDAAYAAKSAAPKKTVELFEKLLPYAMVLGVEQKWASKFEDIYRTPPNWYQGNWTTFNTIYFASVLSSGIQSSVNNAFSAPSSSSGSGFSGGAGGGGGGGGGGGW